MSDGTVITIVKDRPVIIVVDNGVRVIASDSEVFDILNDKATPQVILADATSENNIIPMQATLEVAAGNFTDDVSIPVPGTPLKFRLRDSVGGLFAMTLQPGPGYVEAEDRMYIDFANILFRDEDDPDVNISVIPASTFVVAVYEKTGTTRYTNAITGFAFLPGHLRVWIDEDVIGASEQIGFPLLKTGQTDDFGNAGSDGDFEEGEPILTLRANNPFGHTFRFTGITGGYHDGTDYKDVNGTTTTQALAFPESVMLDWHQYDRDASPRTVRGYNINITPLPIANWGTHNTNAQAYSTATFPTGWRLANERQAFELMSRASNTAGFSFNYPPIFYTILSTSTALWTGTQRGDNSAAAVLVSQTWHGLTVAAKTQTCRALYTRLIPLPELGL